MEQAMIRPRVGDWMQTFTGLKFWPLDPLPQDVRIVDIAASLSKLCRFGGHCMPFYTVAEHCARVADCLPWEYKLAGLLHDAAEAYIGDMVRPLKNCMPEYRIAEQQLEQIIFTKYGVPYPVSDAVKLVDDSILHVERAQCMKLSREPWHGADAAVPLNVTLEFWGPDRAYQEFMNRFWEYGGRD